MKTNLKAITLGSSLLIHILFVASVQAVQPPSQNLKVWISADVGVSTNVDGSVTAWADQSPTVVAGGLAHDGIALGLGVPYLTQRTFTSGSHAVIRLDGASGFALDNVLDATTPAVSVYIVSSVSNSATGGTFVGNTRPPFGYYLGLGTNGAVRWHTGTPEHDISGAVLASDTPYLVESTFKDTIKTLYLGGVLQGSSTGQALTYATWAALTVGAWGTFPNTTVDDTNLLDVTLNGFLTGDVAEVLVYDAVTDAQRLAVEAYIYQKYFAVTTGAVVIAKQPATQQVNETQPVTFAVNANGAPPLTYYWFKNGVSVPNTNGPIYTINAVSRTDAGPYTVIVSNSINSILSSVATLTVIPDTNPPVILSADRDFINPDQVMVVFSKSVSAATATAATNYSINNGIVVSNAVFGATPNTIVLTTSAINFGPAYVLTVNHVQDLVGNIIPANSQHVLAVPDPDALIPTFNLKMWLRGDVGVTADASGVISAWADHQTGSLPKDGTPVGAPILGQDAFPNGPHPVVQFDGASTGFNLANATDMHLSDMTFYMVMSLSSDAISQVMLGNYRNVAGWALGISDSTFDRVKWFTAPPNSLEPADATLTPGTPYLLTATYTSAGGIKRLYLGTNLVGSATGVPLVYASDVQLTVGYLAGGAQWTSGDIAEIIAYSEVSSSQQALVWAYLNDKYFGLGSGPISISSQPKSVTVAELQPASFEVGFKGAAPVSIQWFRNGQPIDGGTNPVYALPSVTRLDQNARYNVVLSNSFNSVTSSNAFLTVVLDTNAPVLLSGTRDYLNSSQVTVLFSKSVTTATGTNAGNYAIDNGVTVNQAVRGPDEKTVFLTTSSIASGSKHTLTVNGIKDLVGNTIATNSRVLLAIPASSVLPATNNLLLWLAADSGITTDVDGRTVTDWVDRAGSPNEHDSHLTRGKPQLALVNFASGVYPVIRFDGASGFMLDNSSDFDMQQFSISIVASTLNSFASEEFIAHWSGWAFGISDSTPGRVKLVSDSPFGSLEPAGADLSNNVPYILTGTFVANGLKQLYVNGNLVGSVANGGIAFSAAGVTVGMLFPSGAQYLHGDIAEILVYSAVSDAQRLAAENYLNQKYFIPAFPAPPMLSVVKQGNSIVLSWPTASTGFSLWVTDSLGAAGAWTTVSQPIVIVGNQNTVTIPIESGSRYYRLKQ